MKIAQTLMIIDNDIWDEMGIECGSDFLDENGTYNELFYIYCSKVLAEVKKINIKNITKKVCETLEDRNYHKLLVALKILKIA